MARKLQVIGKFNLNSVLYTEQTLTTEQKEQARKNIGIDELPSNTAEQIQADYNQNDSSKLDFIKNRPFYEDEPTITEFMPSTEFVFEAMATSEDGTEGVYLYQNAATDEQIAAWNGDWTNAIVTFGDKEYECEAIMLEGIAKAIGNVELMEGTGDNGLPFIILFVEPSETEKLAILYDLETEYVAEGTSTKSIAINLKVANIVKIDKKFLPESTELTEIIEERVEFIPVTTQTSAFDSDYGAYIMGIRLTDEEANTWLNNMDSLIVTFDYVEYECELQEIDGGNGKSAGNLTSFGGTGNDEPFALSMTTVQIDDTTTYYYLGVAAINDTAETEHTITVDFLHVSEKIKEEFLPEIGSGLPEVTAEDNGKIIQVVDGEYQLVVPETITAYTGEVEVE